MGGGIFCLNNEYPSCYDKTWKREWQVAVFILHKLFAVSVYLKSKESCIQKGFVRRNIFIFGLTILVLLFGFLIISGQRYVAL